MKTRSTLASFPPETVKWAILRPPNIFLITVDVALCACFQKLYRWRRNLKEPEPGILFPGITRPDADEGFVSCVKYMFNKFFFHFGWEVRIDIFHNGGPFKIQ